MALDAPFRWTLALAASMLLAACDRPAPPPVPAPAATAPAAPVAAASEPATTASAPDAAAASAVAASAAAAIASAPAGPPDGKLYQVVDGDKVDARTLEGFRAWLAAGCDRCHGANQEGAVGPSLIDSLKRLSKDEFMAVVTNGRIQKGMPNWNGNPTVMGNLEGLYAYLKGRSDGAIAHARVSAMP